MDTRDITEELGVFTFSKSIEELIKKIKSDYPKGGKAVVFCHMDAEKKAIAVANAAGLTVSDVKYGDSDHLLDENTCILIIENDKYKVAESKEDFKQICKRQSEDLKELIGEKKRSHTPSERAMSVFLYVQSRITLSQRQCNIPL